MMNRKIRRIALLTESSHDEFIREMVMGLQDEIQVQNQLGKDEYQCILVDGKYLVEEDDPQHAYNKIYSLVTPEYFDGILVHTGTLGIQTSENILQLFLEKLKILPTVLLGWAPEDCYGIQLDNVNAVNELMDHLIDDHGYKRYLYLGGPSQHKENQLRKKAFIESLEKRDIAINDEDFLEGDFTIESGYRAAKKMIQQDPGLNRWDCLVCANDDMAYGVIEYLQKRNYQIPGDLAVTGIDDADFSSAIYPAITTIDNPFYEMTRQGVGLLIDLIENKEGLEKKHYLPSKICIRESCGCSPKHHLIKINENTENEILYPDEKPEAEMLYSILEQQKTKELKQGFLRHFNQFIYRKHKRLRSNKYRILDYLGMRMQENPDYSPIEQQIILTQLQSIIKDSQIRTERNRIIQNRQTNLRLTSLEEEFRNTLHTQNIEHIITRYLDVLEIPTLCLSLYKDQDNLLHPYIVYHQGTIKEASQYASYKPEMILPQIHFEPNDFHLSIMTPLIYMDQQLGIAFFEAPLTHIQTIPYLARHLGSIATYLFNAQLLEEKNKKLEKSLNYLKLTQERLLESEKLASIGEMLAGIAHEINGPIGVGITLSSHLAEILKDVKSQDPGSKFAEVQSQIEKAHEGMSIMLSNLQKAAEMVKNYKMIAMDQTTEQKRNFALHSYILTIIDNLHSEYKHKNIHFYVDGCKDLKIVSYPGFFSQIMTQLINNSLHHGFKEMKEGEIRILLTQEGTNLIIEYQDNGRGLPEESKGHIFDPFYTTDRVSGRSGLGMHILYNIINNRLNGIIKTDEKQQGAGFTISIPIEEYNSPVEEKD